MSQMGEAVCLNILPAGASTIFHYMPGCSFTLGFGNEEVSQPIFGYKATCRRCIELQGRLLAKFVTGEIEVYPPFLVHSKYRLLL